MEYFRHISGHRVSIHDPLGHCDPGQDPNDVVISIDIISIILCYNVIMFDRSILLVALTAKMTTISIINVVNLCSC
jgi:hypothetical protein